MEYGLLILSTYILGVILAVILDLDNLGIVIATGAGMAILMALSIHMGAALIGLILLILGLASTLKIKGEDLG